jgi:hypothetical protein
MWVPLLAACLGGCVIERPGPTQHDFQTIERDSSDLVRVNLIMGAGNLRVDSGTDKLAAADFTYNVASWKPEMRYTSAAGRGSLTIRQSESHQPHLGKNQYEWDLRLNREVPLDLTVQFGAGEAHLNVGDLTLRSVDVEMGVGRLDLDLDGRPKQSYNVNVSGGVGEATIHLPAGVAVDAEATGGIGSIQASGLRKRGNRYFNDAYPDSKVAIRLTTGRHTTQLPSPVLGLTARP